MEEALKSGEELLRRRSELRNQSEVRWEEKGAGANFAALCELLKGNVISTRKLNLRGDERGKKSEEKNMEMTRQKREEMINEKHEQGTILEIQEQE